MGLRGALLCGGMGVRLRPLSYYIQKTMIPIGSQQRPLIEYAVRLLAYHGVRDIVMLVNYKGEQIMNYFENGERFGVRISYVRDDPCCRGNGGALFNAYRKGFFAKDDTLVIYYGDILSDIDIGAMLRVHEDSGAAATVALSPSYRLPVGVAETDGDGRVVRLVEKPPLGKPVTIGILALEGWVLDIAGEFVARKGAADLMGDVVPELVKRGELVKAFETDAFWYDVGSVEKYEKLDPELVDRIFSYLLPTRIAERVA